MQSKIFSELSFMDEDIVTNRVFRVWSIRGYDLNNDGYNDLIYTSEVDNKVYFKINLKKSHFEHVARIIVDEQAYDTRPVRVEVGDLDGDEDLDILPSFYLARSVRWYENIDNANKWHEHLINKHVRTGFSLEINDFNQDGLNDIVFLTEFESRNNHVSYHKNLGGGNFSEEIELIRSINGPHSFKTLDVNNDKLIDIVTVGWEASQVKWFKNNGNAFFNESQIIFNAPSSHLALAGVADINKDNCIDIVVNRFSSDFSNIHTTWHENPCSESEVAWEKYPIGDLSHHSTITGCLIDIENDGDEDIVGVTTNKTLVKYDEGINSVPIVVFKNLGNGIFSKEAMVITPDFHNPTAFFSTDFNNDGRNDVAYGSMSPWGGHDAVSISFQNYDEDSSPTVSSLYPLMATSFFAGGGMFLLLFILAWVVRRLCIKPPCDECYAAFGITREDAYRKIVERIYANDPIIIELLAESIPQEKNGNYQGREENYNKKTRLKDDAANKKKCDLLKRMSDSELRKYLKYIEEDVWYGKFDEGWAHPGVLKALAYIEKIDLHLWKFNDEGGLIQIWGADNQNTKKRLDLRFTKNNHFIVGDSIAELEIHGLKAGDILLKHTDSSKLNAIIRAGNTYNQLVYNKKNKSDIVHAAIYVGDGKVAEATGDGLQVAPINLHIAKWAVFRFSDNYEISKLAADIAANFAVKCVKLRSQPHLHTSKSRNFFGSYDHIGAIQSALLKNEKVAELGELRISKIIEEFSASYRNQPVSFYCSNFVVFVYALAFEIIDEKRAKVAIGCNHQTILPANLYTSLVESEDWELVGSFTPTSLLLEWAEKTLPNFFRKHRRFSTTIENIAHEEKKDIALHRNESSFSTCFFNNNKSFLAAPKHIRGLKYQRIPGDGHCLYHAVSLYLGVDSPSLRDIVVSYIEGHLNELKNFIQLPTGLTIADYLNAVRNENEWAGHVEIEVLMQVLKRPILVIDAQENIINRHDSERFLGEPIFVYYNGHNHYDALLLTDPYLERSRDLLAQFMCKNSNLI